MHILTINLTINYDANTRATFLKSDRLTHHAPFCSNFLHLILLSLSLAPFPPPSLPLSLPPSLPLFLSHTRTHTLSLSRQYLMT